MNRGTRAVISLTALQHNYARVQAEAKNSKIWAVVKANAYGHGALLISQALSQADGFAVSTLNEAKALREHGIEQPIILLEGVTQAAHWQQAAQLGLVCVVHCPQQLEQLASISLNQTQTLKLWLKFDTGMHRLGFMPEEIEDARARIQSLANTQLVGVMTHLACADDVELTRIEKQIAQFEQQVQAGDALSIGNSAGIFNGSRWQGDWVRPGIMLYGASPFSHKSAAELNLKPVMNFTSPVIALRTIQAGESIGYGHRWTAKRTTQIATLAVGYGDGYPRSAPDGTPVYLNGEIVPIAGRVSMDMLMVDVTDLTHVAVGDVAELWGDHLPVDTVAQYIGTIGYELLTRLSERVPRETRE